MNREERIKQYFQMWVTKDRRGLEALFAENIIYTESFGPQHHGLEEIKRWFDDWVANTSVIRWDVRHFIETETECVVEWYFCYCDQNGEQDIDGVSLAVFNEENKIVDIREFQSATKHYSPYQLDTDKIEKVKMEKV